MAAKKATTRKAATQKVSARKSARQGPRADKAEAGIQEQSDWRIETLSRMRRLIMEADPDVVEERKWKKPSNPAGVPVWSHDGIICTGETYKTYVKLTFAKGALLQDPARLFNSGLEGNLRRAIDIHEGDEIDEKAFKSLVRAAAALNEPPPRAVKAKPAASKPKAAAGQGGRTAATASKPSSVAATPVLLAGGNPQIAKADGDAPVQAYLEAMPGWKRDVGRRLDAIIVRTVPDVRKAVKWNSPFYGVEGQGWFLSFHCFTKYVKVTFFRGESLRPVPPGESKHKEVRYLDIHEDDKIDEAQMAMWIRQAAAIPGWVP